ncbi:tRNA (guanosine(46)-N7)-methyltransferase TrmB [Acidisoma silvae]|uniref:tRNA (guanine-N(7)-)-methyltransferase n=2 Tax=Acidisoma silvae TaxID=2802396 RepID=A0A963YMX5_9PROT|nr:tRNA (guanosine(46)-N7)-methyltransferase TrmB [Acidisoma silvae]
MDTKPQPDRLYGRQRGHALRPRQVWLMEQVLPRLGVPEAAFAAPERAFTNNPEEIWFEVGFGGGEHARALAEANPQTGLIACEVFENGICSMLSALVPDDGTEAVPDLPANLRIWAEDARHLLTQLPDGVLSRLYLMFPDPWPKARHAKRRFVHPANIAVAARVIRPGGIWRIATDDPTYQNWTTEVMAAQDQFEVAAPALERPDGWPPTRYEAKALREGRQPMYWTLTRKATV